MIEMYKIAKVGWLKNGDLEPWWLEKGWVKNPATNDTVDGKAPIPNHLGWLKTS